MYTKSLWTVCFTLLVLVVAGLAGAAPLTEEQYTLLRLDIQADAALADEVSAADDAAIAWAYNQLAYPECWVWRTSIAEQENYEQSSDQGTTWSWAIYKALQPGEQSSWVRMFGATGKVNPSLPNVRTALDAIFGSSGPGAPQRTHLLHLWRRKALRAERLYASVPGGACTTGTPATLTWEGTLRPIDVAHALRQVPLP